MSDDKVITPVFDSHGMDTSGGPKPEKVRLSGKVVGYYIGHGFGLYVDPEDATLSIGVVYEPDPEPLPEEGRLPSDYEVYFATMVLRETVPVLYEDWSEGQPVTDEELETFYALPVYEDHQLPDPEQKGPDI